LCGSEVPWRINQGLDPLKTKAKANDLSFKAKAKDNNTAYMDIKTQRLL